jgi:hypothetical protein
MALTPLESPLTSTGLLLDSTKPLPNLPQFNPQHLAPPPVVSAQVCSWPASMAV